MGVSPTERYTFSFTGGRLCLDFVNTVSGYRAHPRERLESFEDLISWGYQAGILTERQRQQIRHIIDLDPDRAASAFAEAVSIREALFRIFSAAAKGEAVGPADLGALNGLLSRSMARLRVDPGDGGFVWTWDDDPDALDRVLWPVVRSAAELLVSAELARVRVCASETCDWLFLDKSRNHSRRWCDMADCGNRAKARRYYARHVAQHGAPEPVTHPAGREIEGRRPHVRRRDER
jgi:predicted RNA-binding Zn ribbon-like protein